MHIMHHKITGSGYWLFYAVVTGASDGIGKEYAMQASIICYCTGVGTCVT